jgi:hypothetical protein
MTRFGDISQRAAENSSSMEFFGVIMLNSSPILKHEKEPKNFPIDVMIQLFSCNTSILMLALLIACKSQKAQPDSSLSPESASDSLFNCRIDGDSPIVSNGPAGVWDSDFTFPSGVVFFDGLYYLFRKGIGVSANIHGVGYSTSPDGINWTRANETPVFADLGLGLQPFEPLPTSVLLNDNGQWVAYMYGSKTNAPDRQSIWRATAPAPNGPWTADSQPVLQPGSSRTWDGTAVRGACVIRTAQGYLMFYDGYSQANSNTNYIGLATSTDGIHWSKHNDPATTAPLYAESDPVFPPGPAGAWDAGSVQQPRVVQTPDGLIMVYANRGDDRALGLAISRNGIEWQRYSANPILRKRDMPDNRAPHLSQIFYHQNKFFLFVEGIKDLDSNIWLLHCEGHLEPR